MHSFQKVNMYYVQHENKNQHEMKLYITPCMFWKCNLWSHRDRVGFIGGKFTASSRIQFLTIVCFIYCWYKQLTSTTFCSMQLNMRKEVVIDWNTNIRVVCTTSGKLGGKELIAEIDKSLFAC